MKTVFRSVSVMIFALWALPIGSALGQTVDELKARITALEKQNEHLKEQLARRDHPARALPVVAAPQAAPTAPGRTAQAYAAVPPAFGWTGFYAGANFGVSVGKHETRSVSTRQLGVATKKGTETFDLSPEGALAGVQAGANWQFGQRIVVGVEGDYQWSNAKAQNCVLGCTDPVIHAGGLLFDQALLSFGTLRGRLGWSFGPALLYVTGGGAWGQVETNEAHTTAAIGQLSHVREDKLGWTAGGGVEAQLYGNVTAKVEYLYLDFGQTAGRGVFSAAPADSTTFDYSSRLHDHVVRAGLNYRLGPPIESGAYNDAGAAAAPAADWSGFYVGSNAGVAVGKNRARLVEELPPPAVNPFRNDQFDLNPVGGFIGAQAGYLVNLRPHWVLGAEADFQLAHLRDTATCFGNCASSEANAPFFGLPSISASNVTPREDWFTTLRARGGWTNGDTLYYLTGGAALARIGVEMNYDSRQLPPNFAVLGAARATTLATKWGWVAGGGLETKLSPNWSLKSEYLYMDLGNINTAAAISALPTVDTVSSALRTHLFRLGVNYRSDWAAIIGQN